MWKARFSMSETPPLGVSLKAHRIDVDRDVAGRDITYHIVNVYKSAPGKPLVDEDAFHAALSRYLTWVSDVNGFLIFRGIQCGESNAFDRHRERYAPKLALNELYVPLIADEIRLTASKAGVKRTRFSEVADLLRQALQGVVAVGERLAGEHRTGYRAVDLSSILSIADKLVITGGPGSGKTVLLQYIAWVLSSALLSKNADLARQQLGLEGAVPLPVLVPLNAYAKHLQDYRRLSDPKATTLPTFISHYLIRRHAALGLPDDFFERLLLSERALILLLDGLDEVPTEEERMVVSSAIQDFAQAPSQTRIIVSTRTAAYRTNVMLSTDFREIRIRNLEAPLIKKLVERFYQAMMPSDSDERDRQITDLLESLRHLEERRQSLGQSEPLINSPLLMRMLVIVHFNQRSLPDQRAGLYKECIDAMLMPVYHPDTEVALRLSRHAGPLPDQRALYSAIAFDMHSKGERRGRTISEEDMRSVIYNSLRPRYGENQASELTDGFVTAMRERGGLLDEWFGNYQFMHLAFQEFLTARFVAENKRLPHEMVNFYEQENAILDQWWREPILLTAGYLSITNPNTAFDYIYQLADIDAERNRDIRAHLSGLELASVAFLEWHGEGVLRERLAEALACLFDSDRCGQVSASLRAAAGRAYARIGEIREDVACTLPETLHIPEGEFTMGYFDERFRFVDLPSLREGKHRIWLPSFGIGKYPVTNYQFAEFVDDRGYHKKEYWTEAGWVWRTSKAVQFPAYWADPKWNVSSCPVVGISWYESSAYCKWLSEKTGRKFHLPSEAEWEKAARGTDGRDWPFGNDPDQATINSLESGIGETTVVGLFPEDRSPFGLHDCAGNVWEWCNSIYLDYPYSSEDGREDIEGNRPRCHRGGSWLNPKRYAHCANRDRYYPGDRHYDLGFRIAEDIT